MPFVLDEGCSVGAGDPFPCVACTLFRSSGAFPNVWRLGGAGNECAAYTTISEMLCDKTQQIWRTTGEFDGGGGDVGELSIEMPTTELMSLCLI